MEARRRYPELGVVVGGRHIGARDSLGLEFASFAFLLLKEISGITLRDGDERDEKM